MSLDALRWTHSVDDTAPNARGHAVGTVEAAQGGGVSLTRVLLRHVLGLGLFAENPESHLDLTDVTVKDVRPEPADGVGGNGMFMDLGASASFTRVLFDGGQEGGVRVAGAGVDLSGTDPTIRNVAPAGGTFFHGLGFGLEAWDGAHVDLTRVAISHVTGAGAFFSDAMTDVTVHDLGIHDTQLAAPDAGGTSGDRYGMGVHVQNGARVDIEHAVVADNLDFGIDALQSGTSLVLGDVLVRDTRQQAAGETSGYGIFLVDGAQATITGARLERNHDVSVFAYGMGTVAAFSDVEVLDTLANDCPVDTCGGPMAFGMLSLEGASITATHFLVTRSDMCGVEVAHDAGLDLSNGEVSHNVIGANVQVPGFNVQRISDGVYYKYNDSNLGSEMLPVPDLGGSTPSLPMPGAM